MITEEIELRNDSGLHARPASDFVIKAASFISNIQIRNKSLATDWVDAKSILSVLSLGAEKEHTIEIQADGSDEADAISQLRDFIEKDFVVENFDTEKKVV
jgi:phosphocarrier protein